MIGDVTAAQAIPQADRDVIATDQAPAALGPYSQAVRAGNLVYTAGQVGLDSASGKLVEGGVEAQTRQALNNLQAVLDAAGTSMDNVVKVTVFLADINDFAAMNGVYGQFFPADPPARSAVEVSALPLGAVVEIEAVAVTPD